MTAQLHDIVGFLDRHLAIDEIADASLNGLQIEASESVGRVGIAVDAAAATIDGAVASNCDLLFVHHGLFWGDVGRLTGLVGERVARCFRGELSVYAAHLPLDLHAALGNNALLAGELGADVTGTFADYGGVDIGVLGRYEAPVPLAELAGRLAGSGCEDQLMWAFGPDPVTTVAVITGSGASALSEAVAAGADCFITGESRHAAYHEAREAGINCLFAGHYATETFGVRAVGDLLAERFGVEALWLDHPTGV